MDAVEDIKGRLSIEDVIGKYVELKRSGRNFKGLSPFTNEKTPSFMVSPEKQIWHDFSSGKGGNMFSFVMEMEGLDFKGALELLARQAGIDLSQYQTQRSGERGKQKERLYVVLEAATRFYQVQFSKNKTALEYILKKRGFTKETALTFRIGYAPNNDASLTDFLRGKGFNEQEIKRAGLATQRYRGLGDMFRGRIMIPLMDQFGRVIGFTARILENAAYPSTSSGSAPPKYINTPQTPLYDKSRHVFGLHLAKEAIRKINYAVVVEGNLDVIASHQAEVKQTVATAGTAMTEQHLKALGRFTQDVRLAFDQDEAGLAATERTIPIASKAKVSLSIIDIPSGKDPDELIKQDPALWEKAIARPKYAVDWLIAQYGKRLDLSSAQGKREFSDILLKTVQALDDSVEQDHYITQIAELIGVSQDALRAKLIRGKGDARGPLKRLNIELPKLDTKRIEHVKTQNHLLALALVQPELREYLGSITMDMLVEESPKKLVQFLQKNPEFDLKKEADTMQGLGEYVKILLLLYEELYQGLELIELRYEAARLQARLIEQYVKINKTKLAAMMRETGETPELLEKAKQFDSLLNSIKEKSPAKLSTK